MRKIIIILILCSGCASMYEANKTGNHQTKKSKYPKPFEFTLIDSLAGESKNQIYVKANEWMAKTFGSSKAVIQMQDKEAGKLIGKAVFQFNAGFGGHVYTIDYTLSIDAKDGKYRCKLSDFLLEDYGASLDNDGLSSLGINITSLYNKIKDKIIILSGNMQKDLKIYMHSKDDTF